MKFLVALALVSFLGITLFGVLAANHGTSHAFMGCLASLVKGVMCPDQANLFSFATFHLDVFKVFSLAFVLSLFLATVIASRVFAKDGPLQIFAKVRPSRTKPFMPRIEQAISRWLSLLQNSPSVS